MRDKEIRAMLGIQQLSSIKQNLFKVMVGAGLLVALLASTQAQYLQLNERGSIPRAPQFTPEGLACEMPRVWSTPQINMGYPKNPLVVSDTMVFTASDTVSALSREDGHLLWRFTPEGDFKLQDAFQGNGVTFVRLDGDVLYFGGYQRALYALNAQTGEPLWRFDLGAPLTEGIEFDEERVYITRPAFVYAINKQDGTLVWSKQIDPVEVSFNVPRYVDGKLLVQSNKVLYALDGGTGEEVWTYRPVPAEPLIEADATIFAYGGLPHLYRDQIIVQEIDGTLVGVDIASGEMVWKMDARPIIRGLPYMVDAPNGRVILSVTSAFSSLNVADQKMDWWFRAYYGGMARPVAIYKDLVLFGTDYNYIYALDAQTGAEVFRFDFNDDELGGVRTVVARDGVLYFIAMNGSVNAHRIECPQLEGREGW